MSKERGIPPKGVREHFYSIFTKGSEFSKKVDKWIFAVGGAFLLVIPAVGVAIITGNTVTYVAADQIEKDANGKLENLQAKRLGSQKAPKIINFRRNQLPQAA